MDEAVWGHINRNVSSPCTFNPFLLRQVFDNLHRVAQPGMHASGCLISSRYVWAGLIKEVSDWACNCLDCQGAKVICRVYIRLQHIPITTMRFRQIHVDLICFLAKSHGFTHLFTIIDGTSRRAELWPALPSSWDGPPSLASRRSSPRTRGHSSPPPSGLHCASCWAFIILSSLPTIWRPMAWWNISPIAARIPCVPAMQPTQRPSASLLSVEATPCEEDSQTSAPAVLSSGNFVLL